ncbi:MAG: hypothetical protein IPJ69_03470 [Deltaproteobacteria bacterium]|nr:MAG: hypothetical protein IPJ69_03470 [Deltaproteobacteria bacterium]
MPIKEKPTIVIKREVSFIEILCGVVIIFFAFMGALSAYKNSMDKTISQQYSAKAFNLSKEKLDEIMKDRSLHGYRYINNGSYQNPEKLTGENTGFVRHIDIYEVKESDLLTAQAGSDYKRVNVTTSWGPTPEQSVSISTLVTNH